MKKLILILMGLLAIPTLAVTISVDGKHLSKEPGPIVSGGRVLLPLRQVFQALDAQVDYKNQTVLASRGDRSIKLRPYERRAEVNGKPVLLDTPPKIVAGRTYVPLRFVAQALGEPVLWDGATKTVFIGDRGTASAPPTPGMKSKLKQLVVGNQGGILKVRDGAGTSVVYYRGLDDRSTARFSSRDQAEILSHLGVSQGDTVSNALHQVIASYSHLPRKEAIAFLGLLNSLPSGHLAPTDKKKLRTFLAKTLRVDKSVHNRRQAVLALAVGSGVDADSAEAVVNFYRQSENLWETFPVQQYFEYQAHRLKTLPNYATLKSRTLAVNSLYSESIAGYLDGVFE